MTRHKGTFDWFAATALVAVVAAYARAIWFTPPEMLQGYAQKIMYVHVPAAWVAFLSFALTALGGGFWLFLRDPRLDRFAESSAEVGVMFTTVVLVTGPIWAGGGGASFLSPLPPMDPAAVSSVGTLATPTPLDPALVLQQAQALLTRHEIRGGDPAQEKMVYEACWVAHFLARTLRGALDKALVVDVEPSTSSSPLEAEPAWLVWVGIAGETAPSARLVLPGGAGADPVVSVVRRALESAGVLSPAEMKRRPLFLVVPTPTRAIADVAFQAEIPSVFMAGAMSAASLILTGMGLLDGVVLDVAPDTGVASCLALVNGVPLVESRVTAKGIHLLVGPEGAHAGSAADDDEDQEAAVNALVGLARHCVSSLRLPALTAAVRGGGAVLTPRTAAGFACVVTSLQIELEAFFACGCCVQAPHTRWCSASRVASTPEFGHRWFTPATFSGEALRDGNVFPLQSDSYRHEAVTAALRVAQFCADKFSVRGGDGTVEDEALLMAKVQAMNAINETRPEFTSFEGEGASTPPTSPVKAPVSPVQAAPAAMVDFDRPGLEMGNRLLRMIEPLLPRDALGDAKLWMLERFAEGDFRLLDAADAVQVLQALPSSIRDRAVIGAGVTRLDETGEFVV